ncbi:MAG: hypothetical protein PVI83_09520 [Lysobacterales bacterium]|jgi:hypothetical protein
MINSAHIRSFSRLLLMALALMLAACASNAPVEKPASEAEIAVEPWDGDGMKIPLDGSSMEAWDRSMARVKAHTSPKSYQALEGAIKYLLIYDLESYGDKNKLIKRLDGMTGEEVISNVKWWQPRIQKQQQQKSEDKKESTGTTTTS